MNVRQCRGREDTLVQVNMLQDFLKCNNKDLKLTNRVRRHVENVSGWEKPLQGVLKIDTDARLVKKEERFDFGLVA